MIRDMDLIRTLLLEIEKRDWEQSSDPIQIDGFSEEQIHYHLGLLTDAGMIDGIDATSTGGLCWMPGPLTWTGHEFLDAARNDTVWNKVKDEVKKKAVSAPMEIVLALLKHGMKGLFGLA